MRRLSKEQIYNLLEKNGGPPMADTIKCGLWTETHNDCLGCPYAVQCLKAALLSNERLKPPEIIAILKLQTMKDIQELTGG